MRIGIAADHGGFPIKDHIADVVRAAGNEVVDFGARELAPSDDYPDYIVPLAEAVAEGKIERGIGICGSGVGACIAANKVHGVRAGVCQDTFSAHQGVEDDDMNVLCFGCRVVGPALARELVQTFLAASFSGLERYRRRLDKITNLEKSLEAKSEVSP